MMTDPSPCPVSPRKLVKERYNNTLCLQETDKTTEGLQARKVINASRIEWTLLSLGRLHNHVTLVQRLLHDPRLHLNVQSPELTSCHLADVYVHTGCLRLVLSAPPLECQLDSPVNTAANADGPETTFMMAASLNRWETVEALLDSHWDLQEREITHTLDNAFHQNQWNIVLKILKKNHEFDHDQLREILQAASKEESCDVISEILKKGVRLKNMPVGDMLFNRVRCRDWRNVAPLLSLLSSEALLDTTLCEAVLKDGTEITDQFLEEENVYISEREKIVEYLLNRNSYNANTLNAALLIAAVGGTSEAVARLLLKHHRCRDRSVFINTLLLASKHNNLELLPDLLACHIEDYTYKILSQARHIAAENRHLDAAKLIYRALEIKTKEILT
ncbi:uncharacterized protein [Palaemon carinicauda]|uniref:uncharacterized protein n=1 Tax=Palaemon carinicauda TaxID=392227 RepID=UPI0035B60922